MAHFVGIVGQGQALPILPRSADYVKRKCEIKQRFSANSSSFFSTRPPVRPEGHDHLAQLDALLRAVMAVLAEGLQVSGIKEQILVAPMWHHVVDDFGCSHDLTIETHAAQRELG
jgi:hypothetical protein